MRKTSKNPKDNILSTFPKGYAELLASKISLGPLDISRPFMQPQTP